MESQPPQGQQSPDPQKAFSSPLPPPRPGMGGGQAPPPQRPGAPAAPGYPPMYAPMPYPAYPPPAPRHGFVRGIFVTLATTIFGLSLMLNIYLLVINGLLSSAGTSQSTTIVEGSIGEKIAVIPVDGIIDDSMFEAVEEMIQRAEDDASVKAVIFEIDTPGGSVTASDQIYQRIRQFQADQGIPVISSMGGLATSGGYYVACATSHIVAQRTTLTGNIGVLLPRYDASELMGKLGVRENTVESTGSPFKNAGSMFTQDTPEETAYFQSLIDEAYGQFTSVVKEGREGKLKAEMDAIANGKVYSGPEAKKLGLVDQVGYLTDAISHASSAAGLSNPTVVRYEKTPSFSDLILGAQGSARPAAPGVTVHVSPEMLSQLQAPRLMYLWRGQ